MNNLIKKSVLELEKRIGGGVFVNLNKNNNPNIYFGKKEKWALISPTNKTIHTHAYLLDEEPQ